MVLNFLRPGLQRGMFGDYTGNILQHFRAECASTIICRVSCPTPGRGGSAKAREGEASPRSAAITKTALIVSPRLGHQDFKRRRWLDQLAFASAVIRRSNITPSRTHRCHSPVFSK